MFERLSSQFNQSLKTLSLIDAEEQRKKFLDLEQKWEALSNTMLELQAKVTYNFSDPDIPLDQKLISLEQDLSNLSTLFGELGSNIDNEEDFQFCLNQVQVSIFILVAILQFFS